MLLRWTWGTVVAAVIVGVPSAAMSVGNAADIEIPLGPPIDTNVEPGDVVDLTTVSTGPFEGQSCSVRAVRTGGAVRTGTDLRIRSGGDEVVLTDVERAADAVSIGDASIELASTLTISVVIGPDGAFAGGGAVEIGCGSAPPPAGSDSGRFPIYLVVVALVVGTGAAALVALRRGPLSGPVPG